MAKTRTRKPNIHCRAKPAPDPALLLPRLHSRLEKERAGLDRWRKRLLRAFHAYERQDHLVNRLVRQIAKLESA